MAKPFFQVAQNKQPNAQLIANPDHILIGFGEWKFQQDDLVDVMRLNDLLEVTRLA